MKSNSQLTTHVTFAICFMWHLAKFSHVKRTGWVDLLVPKQAETCRRWSYLGSRGHWYKQHAKVSWRRARNKTCGSSAKIICTPTSGNLSLDMWLLKIELLGVIYMVFLLSPAKWRKIWLWMLKNLCDDHKESNKHSMNYFHLCKWVCPWGEHSGKSFSVHNCAFGNCEWNNRRTVSYSNH